MIFGTPMDVAQVTGWTVTVSDSEIFPSKSVRNIGAYLDSALNMRSHINTIIRSTYAQIRSIAKIIQYLTHDAIVKICHAFITSRLDNMNSLLFNLPDCDLQKLQFVQNSTARLIMKQRRSEHITPILRQLHWLPIPFRIQYKLLLLVFKCLLQKAPSYLIDLITPYSPSRSLRSSSQLCLRERKTKKKYGDRAFATCGPKLWNALPAKIRDCDTLDCFKVALKTYLFKCAYEL